MDYKEAIGIVKGGNYQGEIRTALSVLFDQIPRVKRHSITTPWTNLENGDNTFDITYNPNDFNLIGGPPMTFITLRTINPQKFSTSVDYLDNYKIRIHVYYNLDGDLVENYNELEIQVLLVSKS